VNERTQRTPIYHQPRNKSSELGRREEVYFEHGDGVWADGFFPEPIDAKFWDWEYS